jgi:MOSC domain-containing protein YiiM
MGVSGYDNAQWVKKFAAEARPGPYLRVLEEGQLQAGDEIVVRVQGIGDLRNPVRSDS